MYALGIDLGTTYTAAAVWRGGRAEICALGTRSAAVPSVVVVRADGSVLTGDAANRRATAEPDRVAREFKRRIGDTTPILLGGSPFSAEALTARLLSAVVEAVVDREGGAPASICLCHPANWGPYKTDLLREAVKLADLGVPVTYTTEPEAAAVSYARQERLAPGETIAVYDLGGGTFDAAVLRRTETGFSILGQPEGIERLGGIDIDAAVFAHVARALGNALTDLDEDDPAAVAAVARLRIECTDAKEALSSDTDTAIPVMLPSLSTEVRLTRAELESMVRPPLYDSIEALKRALRSADVAAEDLAAVLLVGGSSRMPLVAQLVGAELGRPVAVDAHPKHAIALGAAWLASGAVLPTEPAPATRLVQVEDAPRSAPHHHGTPPHHPGTPPHHPSGSPAVGVAQAIPIMPPPSGGQSRPSTQPSTQPPGLRPEGAAAAGSGYPYQAPTPGGRPPQNRQGPGRAPGQPGQAPGQGPRQGAGQAPGHAPRTQPPGGRPATGAPVARPPSTAPTYPPNTAPTTAPTGRPHSTTPPPLGTYPTVPPGYRPTNVGGGQQGPGRQYPPQPPGQPFANPGPGARSPRGATAARRRGRGRWLLPALAATVMLLAIALFALWQISRNQSTGSTSGAAAITTSASSTVPAAPAGGTPASASESSSAPADAAATRPGTRQAASSTSAAKGQATASSTGASTSSTAAGGGSATSASTTTSKAPTTSSRATTSTPTSDLPGKPASIRLYNATQTTLDVDWGNAPGATRYRLSWVESGSDGRSWDGAPPQYTEYTQGPETLVNLRPGRTYTVTVTPFNDGGRGPGATTSAKTLA